MNQLTEKQINSHNEVAIAKTVIEYNVETIDNTHCVYDDESFLCDTRVECGCDKCVIYIDEGWEDDDEYEFPIADITCDCSDCQDKIEWGA